MRCLLLDGWMYVQKLLAVSFEVDWVMCLGEVEEEGWGISLRGEKAVVCCVLGARDISRIMGINSGVEGLSRRRGR